MSGAGCQITHRQWTAVRPSPHSLCHLCTWASRFRKAFLESGTSRYADQRRNWNWHTTSWPSWSLGCKRKHKTHGICVYCTVWAYAHVLSCVCELHFLFVLVFLHAPVNTHVWVLPWLRTGTLSCARSADWLWDIWVCRCKWGPSCVWERSLCVHNLVLYNLT